MFISANTNVCQSRVISLGSEDENNPSLIFWMTPTLPTEASNNKLQQPVRRHVPVRNRRCEGFTLGLLVVTFSLCWHGSGLRTKSWIHPDWNFKLVWSSLEDDLYHCSYLDEHVGFVCSQFINHSLSHFPFVIFFIFSSPLPQIVLPLEPWTSSNAYKADGLQD